MKAIIFDLDGTLLNTLDDIADSMNEVLRRHGLPLRATEEYKYFVGDGALNLVRRAASGAEAAGLDTIRLEEEYSALYLLKQADKTAPYDGIPELLSTLAGRGVKIAVLSNKPHDATLKILSRYFPDTAFDAIIGHRPGHPVKPDPDGALEILGILGLPREEVLYLGDTGTDMQTAANAGLKAIGALWGFRERSELSANGAYAFAEHPSDVLDFL